MGLDPVPIRTTQTLSRRSIQLSHSLAYNITKLLLMVYVIGKQILVDLTAMFV